MLRALGDPVSLVVLLLSAVSAVVLLGWTSSLVALRTGSPEVRAEQRQRPDPRRHLDPFGVIGALLAGPGWARPVPLPFRRTSRQLVATTLSGPLACLLVGAVLLVALGLVGGPVGGTSPLLLQYGATGPLLEVVLLLAGLVHLLFGLLSLVPLPPLPGGQVLLGLAPRTPGWQKAEMYLVERNLGLVAVLVLLLLPLGGGLPLLLELLGIVAEPLVRLLTGAAG